MTDYVSPVWENKPAPCGGPRGCPAETDIAAALHALSRNEPARAWRIMMQSHPLRGTLGRVCYAFCEEPCNRGHFDKAISIQTLEAIIGDEGYDAGYRPELRERTGKRVLVVGAGPAGIAAAWYLNIAGYETIIHEAAPEPGGVLRYGIPSYRLPKNVLTQEIDLVVASGVVIKTEAPIEPEEFAQVMADKKYDGAIICIGAGEARKAGFPGEDATLEGLTLLRQVNEGSMTKEAFLGKKVVVVGGGNVAMDACRSAIRLGAASVTVCYRRTESAMPAHQYEVDEAREEGVTFSFLLAPTRYETGRLTLEKMAPGERDESKRQSVAGTGEELLIDADSVIMAIGQKAASFDVGETKIIRFAGDVNPESPGTVIHAIAAGKREAESLNRALGGEPLFAPQPDAVTGDKMNVARYFEPQMRMRLFHRPAASRIADFEPVAEIPSREEGVVEGDRCFRCGLCIGGLNSDCDWCFRACGAKGGVEKAMVEWNETGPLFSLDAENCDSCGKCWEDCPRYVVTPQSTSGKI